MMSDVVDLAQIQSENQPCEKLLLFYIPAKKLCDVLFVL